MRFNLHLNWCRNSYGFILNILINTITARIKDITFSGNGTSTSFTIRLHETTGKDIRFCEWGTPFEQPLEGNMFDITHNGTKIPYKGVLCKRGNATSSTYSTFVGNSTVSLPFTIRNEYNIYSKGKYKIRLDCWFTTIEGELIKVKSKYFKFEIL